MKNLLKFLLFGILFSSIPISATSQVNIGVNLNFSASERYYYIQDEGFYYDSQTSMYIIQSSGNWTRVRTLPARYNNFNFQNSHKIIIRDYTGNRPYNFIKIHKTKFPKGYYASPDKNYWSAKEYKIQRNNFKPQRKHNGNYMKSNGHKSKNTHKGNKGKK
jgi:hypothetical protein